LMHVFLPVVLVAATSVILWSLLGTSYRLRGEELLIGNVPRSVESRRRFRPDIYATFSCVSSVFLLTTVSSEAIS
jgi:hypothetical protein